MTTFHPDDGLPQARTPVDFFLRLHADRITFLSMHTQRSEPVDMGTRTTLVDAAIGVLDGGDEEEAPDTAVGRSITRVELRADVPVLGDGLTHPPFVILAVNHCAHGGAERADWLALLDAIEALLGPRLAPPDCEHLHFLRAHFVPSS